ncbi:hypothetical protein [Leptospira levettii]|uniref:hypothetical protein n=1 Tax=Leptospira levettii TaxID=2023178 RepID=UPI003EBD6723
MTTDIKEKNEYIIQELLILESFLDLNLKDLPKRLLFRQLFILIDDFLIWAPRLINFLFRNSSIDRNERDNLKLIIAKVKKEYDNKFSTIRDKLSAHHQPIEFLSLIECIFKIQYSTIQILIDDINIFYDLIKDKTNLAYSKPVNNTQFKDPIIDSNAEKMYSVSSSRLAHSTDDTVGMLPFHETQEKGSLIVSIIDSLDYMIRILIETNTQNSPGKNLILGLIINDTISFLENLFNNNQYDRSLVSIWKKNHYRGVSLLESFERDEKLEEELIYLRNKFCSHIDDTETLNTLKTKIQNININALINYIEKLINIYNRACKMQIQTIMMIFSREQLIGVLGLSSKEEYKPLDDTNCV